MFGLSDLHQIAMACGRVIKSICYLLTSPMSGLLRKETRKRRQTLENFRFGRWLSKVAMKRFWTSRGAGEIY